MNCSNILSFFCAGSSDTQNLDFKQDLSTSSSDRSIRGRKRDSRSGRAHMDSSATNSKQAKMQSRRLINAEAYTNKQSGLMPISEGKITIVEQGQERPVNEHEDRSPVPYS